MTTPTIIRPALLEKRASGTSKDDAPERRSIAKWLLTTFFFVLLSLTTFELAGRLLVFASKPANSPNPQYDTKYRVARTLSPAADNIVLCGDSLMKEGIYPELVASKLKKSDAGIRVVNLAVTGGTQRDAVHYLDFLAARGVRPKLVVFDYEVSNTCLPTEANNLEWGQSHSYLFRGLLSRPKSFKDSVQVTPNDVSYLFRQRANLKRTISEFFNALAEPKKFEEESFFQLNDAPQLEVSKSGMAPNNKIEDKLDWQEEKRKIGFFTPFCPQSSHFQYNPNAYSIIIDYCQSKNIPLLLVWLPHQTKVYNAFYYKAPFNETWQKKQFESLNKFPLVSTEYLNVLPDDSIYFHDYRHLNTYGCVKASELLAAALEQDKYLKILSSRKDMPSAQKAESGQKESSKTGESAKTAESAKTGESAKSMLRSQSVPSAQKVKSSKNTESAQR